MRTRFADRDGVGGADEARREGEALVLELQRLAVASATAALDGRKSRLYCLDEVRV